MGVSTSVNKEEGSTWVRFDIAGDWSWFPIPMNLFEHENDCVVLSNHETTTSRAAILKKEDIEFELWHDDFFGNYLSTNNPQHVPALKQLAENVLKSIYKSETPKETEVI